MSRDHTRDLAWWQIPTWTAVFPRALIVGAQVGLAVWLGLGLLYRSLWLTQFHHLVGLVSGLGGTLGAWLASRKPPRTAPKRWEFLLGHSSVVFVLGVVFGYMLTFDFTALVNRLFPSSILIGLIVVGIAMVLAIWLLAGLAIRFHGKTHHPHIAMTRWRAVHGHPCIVFAVGLGFGFMSTITINVVGGIPWIKLVYVPVGVLTLVLGFKFAFGSLGPTSASPLTPLASWSRYRATGLGIWFGLGGLAGGFLVRAGIRGWGELGYPAPRPALAIVLGLGLVFGLVLGAIYPETWVTSIACGLLAIRRGTPVGLMQFLDDARERNVLRTVGPIYQFRHARFQDHLSDHHTAATTPPARPRPTRPAPALPTTLGSNSTTDQSPR